MNKYVITFIFYLVAIAIVFILDRVSPTAQDGGPGLGGMAIVVFMIVIAILLFVTIYHGFKTDKSYFILAAIHLLALLISTKKFFL